MWQLKMWVFVLGVAVNGAVGRSFSDTQEDVGIIGGDEVVIEQYPHQVSLVLHGSHTCGGSIISEQYVLTAAHCVNGKIASDFQVRAGSSYRTLGGELYDVESITQHPLYDVEEAFDYDVAVMKIAGRIIIDGVTTNIVQLAHPDSELRHGELMTVSGWGYTSWYAHPSNVLKAAYLPVVDKEHCSQLWRSVITDRMICAGSKLSGQSACKGDSGGPLIDSNFVQYGIVSFGEPLCHLRPTVFASVANLRFWIKHHTGV